MNTEILEKIAKEYRTPSYVFDTDLLTERINMIRSSLGENIRICYAMKANPFLIKPLESVTDCFEVCSPGEFRICERAGIKREQIVLSGVYKEKKDILPSMLSYGDAGVYTIESLSHLELLEACAKEADVKIQTLIRVTSGNQFGVDEEEICEIIQNREKYPHIHFKGLQHYSGTQKKKMSKIGRELRYLDEFIALLKEKYQYEAEELEFGPGFHVPYFLTDEEADDRAVLEEFKGILESLEFKGRITLEMGRYIAAYCGYYLTSIVDQKMNQGQNYCIVDGGIHHLTYFGQAMAMKVPHYQHISSLSQKKKVEKMWNICGSLCTVNDVIVKQLSLCGAGIGDILVFERTGAYSVTEGMYLFLSRDLPQILFYSDENGIETVRERRGTDEITAG